MKLFEKRPRAAAVQTAAAQTRSVGDHPFGILDGYAPLRNGEIRLYRAIREAVPIVDAAILKLIRLCGGLQVVCDRQEAQAELDHFLKTMNTGWGQRGIQSFLDCYLDSMVTCGRAVGEIVPTPDGRDIAAVLCANVANIAIQDGETPMDFRICTYREGGKAVPLPYQELLLFTPFQPETDNPYGVSMMRSMPFLTEILLKIYHAIGLNWERMGNVRFSVIYKPEGDELERSYAQERCQQIAQEWTAAMQEGKHGHVKDFIAVGNVEIKAIGADNQILDSEVPVRQILEQLIARTGIPPFLLGISWSSTDRMSAQQADIMTSEITAIRRSLSPTVERICEYWLRVHGYGGSVNVEWDDMDLQDMVEEAKAELYREQAQVLREENGQKGETECGSSKRQVQSGTDR